MSDSKLISFNLSYVPLSVIVHKLRMTWSHQLAKPRRLTSQDQLHFEPQRKNVSKFCSVIVQIGPDSQHFRTGSIWCDTGPVFVWSNYYNNKSLNSTWKLFVPVECSSKSTHSLKFVSPYVTVCEWPWIVWERGVFGLSSDGNPKGRAGGEKRKSS